MTDPKYMTDFDGNIMVDPLGNKILFKDYEEDPSFSENREPLEDVLEHMEATEIIDMLKAAGQWHKKPTP